MEHASASLRICTKLLATYPSINATKMLFNLDIYIFILINCSLTIIFSFVAQGTAKADIKSNLNHLSD